MHAIIDLLGKSQVTDEAMHQTDTAVVGRQRAIGQLVLDVGGIQHRAILFRKMILVEPPPHSLLAVTQTICDTALAHSKSSVHSVAWFLLPHKNCPEMPEVSS